MIKDILTRNNVKTVGKGVTPMLFAHGFGCDQNTWRFVVPSFIDDYKIVLFDYVGSGKSDLSAYNAERYSNLYGYASDVLEICEALGLKDVIFVGHSVSSMIGILAAIRKPEYFSNLILIGPSPRYINENGYVGGFEKKDIEEFLDNMEKNFIGWANFIVPAIIKNPDRPELSTELAESFCSGNPQIARNFAIATFFSDNRRDLLNLKKPTLIMQCSEDIIAPIEVGDYLHAHLANSTLKSLKATGHYPHLSHPDETIQVMKKYLKRKANRA